jgi:CobQ-like glutamine amidotransferase family enzyme
VPGDTALVVVLVYPELLGTYGDRGNAVALLHRARARGLEVELVEVAPGDPVPTSADVYLLGGGEDSSQILAWQELVTGQGLLRALDRGASCLAVCAGFQLLAESFADPDGTVRAGLGVLDVSCGRLAGERAVGEVVSATAGVPGLGSMTGYENHRGDARLGQLAKPLGWLVKGVGNGDRRTEGAVQGNVVATYLHGPVLVRNPALADHLLQQRVGPLAPFDDEAVEQLRRERLSAVLPRQRGIRSWLRG